MFCKNLIICALFVIGCVVAGSLKEKKDATVTIQATNNTLVPNIMYTVDAVECLKEAYSVYVDEASRAEAFSELFAAKHEGNWSVAVGYTTLISKSTIYVEALVSGEKNLKGLGSDSKGVLFRIFN